MFLNSSRIRSHCSQDEESSDVLTDIASRYRLLCTVCAFVQSSESFYIKTRLCDNIQNPFFQTTLLGSVSRCIHLQSPYLSHDRATHNYSSWINKRVLIVIPQKANTRTIVETGTKTVTSFLPSSAQVLLINRPWKLECHVLVRLLIRLSERPWKLKLQALVKYIMLKMFTKEASISANIGSCILYEVPQQLIKPLDLNMVLSPNHFYICGTNSV